MRFSRTRPSTPLAVGVLTLFAVLGATAGPARAESTPEAQKWIEKLTALQD